MNNLEQILKILQKLTTNMTHGQYWICFIMTIMIVIFGLGCLFEYLELKKANKKREYLLRKKKWLDCELKCELVRMGL